MDDIPGPRIDLDRATRAFPFQSLHGGDQRVAVSLASGFLERFEIEMHAVVAADRDGVRALAVSFLESATKDLLVGEPWTAKEWTPSRSENCVGHARKLVLIGKIASAHNADARLVHAALDELFREDPGRSTWKPDEQSVGI